MAVHLPLRSYCPPPNHCHSHCSSRRRMRPAFPRPLGSHNHSRYFLTPVDSSRTIHVLASSLQTPKCSPRVFGGVVDVASSYRCSTSTRSQRPFQAHTCPPRLFAASSRFPVRSVDDSATHFRRPAFSLIQDGSLSHRTVEKGSSHVGEKGRPVGNHAR